MTEGVECSKDGKLIDETPKVYKPIDEVMLQQSNLVEVLATLKQVFALKVNDSKTRFFHETGTLKGGMRT